MAAKKKDVDILVALGGKPSSAPEEDMGDAPSMGLEAAAEEILAAVGSNDASALSSALKAFVEQCSYEETE